MSELDIFIITILAISIAITFIYKFYQGIWLIHKSIDKQNKILEEQNEILLKFLEEHDNKKSACNS